MCSKEEVEASRSRWEGSSLSNCESAWARHMELEMVIDFDKERLTGVVTYTVERADATVGEFVVDTAGGLEITKAWVDGAETRVEWGATENEILGRSASVRIEKDRCEVKLAYATGDRCSGAQWLTASQTSAKTPFLFTQSQAIHGRSLFPCQDAPGAKLTWSGTVACPKWATLLASGVQEGQYEDDDLRYTKWRQPTPTSTYLIAFVCGTLSSRELSDRCRVWAEPSVADAAAYDFADTEKFLKAAEDITQVPYAWGRYDFVTLPASFPYGGMENANLTTVTPTLLAGDRSLAGVVAHEIAHSWTGNLVTNASWRHFWLNEGWTRWLERKIRARVAGLTNPKDAKRFIDFDVAMARGHLSEDVALFIERGTEKQFTPLIPDLTNPDGTSVDPDDAFSSVPYEKGSGLLHYLEHLVGEKAFLNFAREYLKTYQRRVVTSDDFRQLFVSKFRLVHVDWKTWFHAPGDLPEKHPLDTALVDEVETIAHAWGASSASSTASDDDALNPPSKFDAVVKKWPADRVSYFLDLLLLNPDLSLDVVLRLDQRLRFSQSQNAETKFRWAKLLLQVRAPDALRVALDMATSQGRMKFTRPLYRAAAAYPGALDAVVATFQANQAFYHPICRKMVASDLDHALKKLLHSSRRRSSRSNLAAGSLFAGAIVFSAAFLAAFLTLKRTPPHS